MRTFAELSAAAESREGWTRGIVNCEEYCMLNRLLILCYSVSRTYCKALSTQSANQPANRDQGRKYWRVEIVTGWREDASKRRARGYHPFSRDSGNKR